MNKKQITGLVLTIGLLAGGFGVSAMADESTAATTPTQTVPQTQPENGRARGFGNFMGRMRPGFNGGGFGGGFYGSDLTAQQQEDLAELRTQAQNIMVDYREEQLGLREDLTAAIESASKDDVITAWDALSTFHDKIQLELEEVQGQISAIVGREDTFMGGRFEDSYMTEQIEALRTATDEEAAAIIEDLQNLGNRGMRSNNDSSQNGAGRGRGRGGRMMNPGSSDQNNNNGNYRGNGF